MATRLSSQDRRTIWAGWIEACMQSFVRFVRGAALLLVRLGVQVVLCRPGSAKRSPELSQPANQAMRLRGD